MFDNLYQWPVFNIHIILKYLIGNQLFVFFFFFFFVPCLSLLIYVSEFCRTHLITNQLFVNFQEVPFTSRGLIEVDIFFKVWLINLQNDQTTTKFHFINLSTCIKKNILKSIGSIRSIKLEKHYRNYSVWSLNSYLEKRLEYLL